MTHERSTCLPVAVTFSVSSFLVYSEFLRPSDGNENNWAFVLRAGISNSL